MTIQEFLKSNTHKLDAAGISSARLDCLVLLEDALGVDRGAILAHPEIQITSFNLAKLNKKVVQRTQHLPLAYIRGETAFFGRRFVVNKHVLVPRPETEILIEMLKNLSLPSRPKIADIGCGSGCIGVTAALELPGAIVELYDIDSQALELAAANAKTLDALVTCHQSNLLDDQPAADALVTNLPYVPDHLAINRAAMHEPKHAIFGGSDGLSLYRTFWRQVDDLPIQPLFILCESLPSQHKAMYSLAQKSGYQLRSSQEFIQVFERL
jgi:release factor glutamine methyltransferase